jgi:mono/diheme cytochrome c family protein
MSLARPSRRRSVLAATLTGLLAMLAGCGPSPPPAFRLNLEGRNSSQINRQQEDALTTTLARLFGTPDEPALPSVVELDMARLQAAAGPIGSDEAGRLWGLYRKRCVGCHGISGDGAGPNAATLKPYPRDFRNGTFKYTSTFGGAKPSRTDLERTLARGVPGTAMPSFARLEPGERDALVEYVIYLSIRGETELYLLDLVVDQDEYPVIAEDIAADGAEPAFRMWQAAELQVVAPPPEPSRQRDAWTESVARGKLLYATVDAQCVKCHGQEGRGDGEQADDLFDDWNKRKKGASPAQTAELAPRFALPLQALKARDFAEGVFQGGDRPIDLYWRIHVGIKGTPMPAAGPAPGSSGVYKPDEIWDVVHYVESLVRSRRR